MTFLPLSHTENIAHMHICYTVQQKSNPTCET